MKKKFLLLLTALASTLLAQADNVVVKDVTIPQGGTATVEVELNNPDHEFTAFQMSLQVPEGITAVTTVKNDKEVVVTTKGTRFDDHQLSTSAYTGGYGFAALSASSYAIKDQSGVLFSFDLQADAALEVGSTLQAKFTGIAFSTTGAAATEVAMDDVTFTITTDEPDDGYIKFNETSTALPKYTAGEKGNVRMTRSIKAGEWSTIVLPFTLTKAKAEAAFGSDVQLAEFAGFEVEYADEEDVTPDAITINFTDYTMTPKKGMTGGKPFLIKTSQDITTFEAEDVTLADAVTAVSKSDEYDTAGKFTGTLIKSTVPADGLFIAGNKFWYSTGATAIKAFRGWFELGAVLDKETDFGVKMAFIDGVETRISDMGNRESNGQMFDLSGRRVTRTQHKGVYVIDGKKVVK